MTPLHVDVRVWHEDGAAIEDAILTIERTDDDEISLAILEGGSPERDEVLRCWIDVDSATRLAALLGVAALANEIAAHEAAKLEKRRQEPE